MLWFEWMSETLFEQNWEASGDLPNQEMNQY